VSCPRFRLHKAVFLTVDAPTVLLAVQAEIFSTFLAFLPSNSEILIVERNAESMRRFIAESPNEIMFLQFAVQQGCRKSVEAALFGQTGGRFNASRIAVDASPLLSKGNLPKKDLRIIVRTNNEFQTYSFSKVFQGGQAFLKLLVRLNEGIVEKAVDKEAEISQPPERINCARATASMKKYSWHYQSVSRTYWNVPGKRAEA
jgi:hypothetical protein